MFIWLVKTDRSTGRSRPPEIVGGFKITSSVSYRTSRHKKINILSIWKMHLRKLT